MLGILAILAGAFVAAVILTGALVRLAPRLGWIDVPNERSMHLRPTPRGGGLAIVLCVVLVTAVLWASAALPSLAALALLFVAGVALVGGLDDRYHLPDAVRLPAWIALAIATTLAVGGLPRLDLGAWVLPLGVAGGALLVVGLVWTINLYNFMDGIDGLAAAQALVAASAGSAMLFTAGLPGLGLVAGVLAAASAGFLVWNRPPARIFMGDVGSGSVGFVFAVLAVLSEREGGPPIVVWAILVAPFLVDATFTVIRRALAGEPFHKPHRTHAYQRAVQREHSHGVVSLAYGAIALLLAPVAWVAWWVPVARLPVALGVVIVLGLAWARVVAPVTPPQGFKRGRA